MECKKNWKKLKIGLCICIFIFCVGLATFKDTFWSSDTNPDHPFYYDCMIGEDVTDPNIPWTVRNKSNGKCTRLYLPRYILRYGLSINILSLAIQSGQSRTYRISANSFLPWIVVAPKKSYSLIVSSLE